MPCRGEGLMSQVNTTRSTAFSSFYLGPWIEGKRERVPAYIDSRLNAGENVSVHHMK
jgi:hypothetical protein